MESSLTILLGILLQGGANINAKGIGTIAEALKDNSIITYVCLSYLSLFQFLVFFFFVMTFKFLSFSWMLVIIQLDQMEQRLYLKFSSSMETYKSLSLAGARYSTDCEPYLLAF